MYIIYLFYFIYLFLFYYSGNKDGEADTAKDGEGDAKEGDAGGNKDTNGDTVDNKDNDGVDHAGDPDTKDGDDQQNKDPNKDSEDDGAVPNKSDPLDTDHDLDHLADLVAQDKKPHVDEGDDKKEEHAAVKRDLDDADPRHLDDNRIQRPNFNPLEGDERLKEDEIRSLFKHNIDNPNFDQKLQDILSRNNSPRDGPDFRMSRNGFDENQLEQPFRNRDEAIERMREFAGERVRRRPNRRGDF